MPTRRYRLPVPACVSRFIQIPDSILAGHATRRAPTEAVPAQAPLPPTAAETRPARARRDGRARRSTPERAAARGRFLTAASLPAPPLPLHPPAEASLPPPPPRHAVADSVRLSHARLVERPAAPIVHSLRTVRSTGGARRAARPSSRVYRRRAGAAALPRPRCAKHPVPQGATRQGVPGHGLAAPGAEKSDSHCTGPEGGGIWEGQVAPQESPRPVPPRASGGPPLQRRRPRRRRRPCTRRARSSSARGGSCSRSARGWPRPLASRRATQAPW